jgi:uncharacterized protein YycO
MDITPMPKMEVTPYEDVRPCLEPGMVVFFSQDTSGLKKITQFISWRIKCDQTPPHDCTHVGMVDIVRGRRILIEATSPSVRVSPLSMFVGKTTTPDGRIIEPYDGKVYIGKFKHCFGYTAASQAWENLLLPYDYLDLAAIRLGIKRQNAKCYICSELVAEALVAGRAILPEPANGWAYTPADLALSCEMLWRLR